MLKKIIHPKTGFSIYMKPFKDSPLFQVSTTETFNINGLHSSYNSPVNICSTTPHMEAIQNSVVDLKNEHKQTQAISKQTIEILNNQNKHLRYYLVGCFAAFLLSILL